jgi:pilus assembly protein CpaB
MRAFASRPMDSNTTFTTGGDVSRFQRRTVPSATAALPAAGAPAGAAPAAAMPSGPIVRVARGNQVTVVPVGAR